MIPISILTTALSSHLLLHKVMGFNGTGMLKVPFMRALIREFCRGINTTKSVCHIISLQADQWEQNIFEYNKSVSVTLYEEEIFLNDKGRKEKTRQNIIQVPDKVNVCNSAGLKENSWFLPPPPHPPVVL